VPVAAPLLLVLVLDPPVLALVLGAVLGPVLVLDMPPVLDPPPP